MMLSVSEWISFFSSQEKAFTLLKKDYGDNYPHLEEKRKIIDSLLKFHLSKFGDEQIFLIRSPGRVNLMGRHIDHQGGNVNVIAIDKEIFLTVSERLDQKINVKNINKSVFKPFEFDYSTIDFDNNAEWEELVNDSDFISKFIEKEGDWSNYFKGVVIRLLHNQKSVLTKGANISISGNIPIGSGLSSSSALIVGAFHALTRVNNLFFEKYEFVNLCAEAEWFVGTRGGASDHAAIQFSRKSQITHIKFFELKILERQDFPINYSLLICTTPELADKSGSKKDFFNRKVFAYDIGMAYIRKKFPHHAYELERINDVNMVKLELFPLELMNVLVEIPKEVEYEELPWIFPNEWDFFQERYHFEKNPQKVTVRNVVLYGVSECERSRRFIQLMEDEEYREAGMLMNISHDGDRIVRYDSSLTMHLFEFNIDDVDYSTSDFNLSLLPGAYGCSTKQIDFIVDLAKLHKGVLGAQLSGAGLGGSAMILIENQHAKDLQSSLEIKYQQQFDQELDVFSCISVNGVKVYNGNELNLPENIVSTVQKGKLICYSHQCVRCTNCCSGNFDIPIERPDLAKWENFREIVHHIQIYPESIALTGFAVYGVEKDNAVTLIRKNSTPGEYEEKKNELIEFILQNHHYHGERHHKNVIDTIIPDKERNPVLTPKNFDIIRAGWKRGLKYILSLSNEGVCPYLKDGLCSINEFKPRACRRFPYDNHGFLRADKYVIKICDGYKKEQNPD